MRYFLIAKDAKYKKRVETIVSECINIMLNGKYYHRGVLLDKFPVHPYNIYKYEDSDYNPLSRASIDYEIYTNTGTIIIRNLDTKGKADNIIEQNFATVYAGMMRAVYQKFQHDIYLPACGTTRYTLTTTNAFDVEHFIENTGWSFNKYADKYARKPYYNWTIYYASSIDMLENHIDSTFRYSSNPKTVDDCINYLIFDDEEDPVYAFHDGYSCINFPTIDKTRLYNKKIFNMSLVRDTHIDISTIIGNYHSSKPVMTNCGYKLNDIHWIKWEDVKPNIIKNIDILKNGIVRNYTPGIVDEQDFCCCVSGVPIAEDCYVMDIYQYIDTRHIPREKIEEFTEQGYICVEESDVQADGKKEYIAKKAIDIDEPYHLLLSSYGIQVFIDKFIGNALPNTNISGNIIKYIESYTNCNFILYRTFCQRTYKQLIDGMNVSPVVRNIFHSLNRNIKYFGRGIQTTDQDGNIYDITPPNKNEFYLQFMYMARCSATNRYYITSNE